jgi:hypothetical protein
MEEEFVETDENYDILKEQIKSFKILDHEFTSIISTFSIYDIDENNIFPYIPIILKSLYEYSKSLPYHVDKQYFKNFKMEVSYMYDHLLRQDRIKSEYTTEGLNKLNNELSHIAKQIQEINPTLEFSTNIITAQNITNSISNTFTEGYLLLLDKENKNEDKLQTHQNKQIKLESLIDEFLSLKNDKTVQAGRIERIKKMYRDFPVYIKTMTLYLEEAKILKHFYIKTKDGTLLPKILFELGEILNSKDTPDLAFLKNIFDLIHYKSSHNFDLPDIKIIIDMINDILTRYNLTKYNAEFKKFLENKSKPLYTEKRSRKPRDTKNGGSRRKSRKLTSRKRRTKGKNGIYYRMRDCQFRQKDSFTPRH